MSAFNEERSCSEFVGPADSDSGGHDVFLASCGEAIGPGSARSALNREGGAMRVLVALLIACTCVALSNAQTRDLTFVVRFAAGGTSSTAARILGDSPAPIEGDNALGDNLPTAARKLAASRVMQSESSQMRLVMSATSLLRIPPDIGLVPVGIFAKYKYVLATRRGASLNLLAYMAAARRDKRPRNVATAGAGSVAHLI